MIAPNILRGIAQIQDICPKGRYYRLARAGLIQPEPRLVGGLLEVRIDALRAAMRLQTAGAERVARRGPGRPSVAEAAAAARVAGLLHG